MHFPNTFFLFLFSIFLFVACKSDSNSQVTKLEADYAVDKNFDIAKQLVTLYRDEAKKKPEANQSFDYFVKAADLQFYVMRDALSAVRWLDDILAHYGTEKTDKSEAYVLLAEIYRDYRYKSAEAARLDIDDIDKMIEHLQKGYKEVEKARSKLKKEMLIDSTMQLDPKIANRFINVSEALAMLYEKADPNRAVELNIESGNAARAYGDFQRAIRMYFAVSDQNPENPRASEALFMAAFTYDNDLGDFENAKKTYQMVIDRFPQSKFAADSKELVKIIGKPLEEVIEGFEEKTE